MAQSLILIDLDYLSFTLFKLHVKAVERSFVEAGISSLNILEYLVYVMAKVKFKVLLELLSCNHLI